MRVGSNWMALVHVGTELNAHDPTSDRPTVKWNGRLTYTSSVKPRSLRRSLAAHLSMLTYDCRLCLVERCLFSVQRQSAAPGGSSSSPCGLLPGHWSLHLLPPSSHGETAGLPSLRPRSFVSFRRRNVVKLSLRLPPRMHCIGAVIFRRQHSRIWALFRRNSLRQAQIIIIIRRNSGAEMTEGTRPTSRTVSGRPASRVPRWWVDRYTQVTGSATLLCWRL